MLFENWHPLIVLWTTAYIGAWAHESAHYLAGIPWTRKQEMKFRLKIFPHRVDWSRTDVRPFVYRVAGAAPLILLVPGALLWWCEAGPFVYSGQWVDAFVRLPLIAAGLLSRGDIRAVVSPEDWMDSA